jgi:enamine deaminase RidA (YjgF/YER057c/UK114 family)
MSTQLLFASGAVADAAANGLSVGEETRLCIEHVAAHLAKQGGSLSDLLKAVIYVTPGMHAEVWAAWEREFAAIPARPMRLTQLAGLAPGLRVAIDVVAQLNQTGQVHP